MKKYSMIHLIRCTLFLSLLFLGVGCISIKNIPQDHQATFLFAVEQQQSKNYALSSVATWKYLKEGGEEDSRYDRGLRLMARNAEKLDLNYAASLWYLEIARGRRDAELIPEALLGIQKLIESGIYDEDALVTGFIAVEEMPKLNTKLESFINYYQGLHNLRQGLDQWAMQKFALIHPNSFYAQKASYVSAVRLVALGHLNKAQVQMEKLLKSSTSIKLKQELMTSLARLAMQQGKEIDALKVWSGQRREMINVSITCFKCT